MAKYRKDRINDAVMHETASVLRDIKDPRVADAFVSITGAEVSADLKYARIYFSALGCDMNDKAATKKIIAGLKSASGFIRGRLASALNLRITPELTFVPDLSIAHGAHIAELFNSITITHEEDNEGDNTDDNTSDNTDDGE